MRKLAIFVIAAIAELSTPAAAKVETAVIKDGSAVQINPVRAYILIASTQASPLVFYRVADDAAQAAYDGERGEAYAKARAKYEKKLASYEKRYASWEKSSSKSAVAAPTKPDEVNLETFAYPDIEHTNKVALGPLNRFAKGDRSLYLQEVDPGEYVFYSSGACMCMGTVKFTAEPGVVTYMGSIGMTKDKYQALPKRTENEGESMVLPPIGYEGTVVIPATDTLPDPRLVEYTVVPAKLSPVGWLQNWQGGAINRVNPIPGILEYDRGKVLGLEPEVASEPAALAEVVEEPDSAE